MITLQSITTALNKNRLSGKIETGQRFWVCDFITCSFYESEEVKEAVKFLQNLPFSVSPIEKTSTELSNEINKCALKAFEYYKSIK